MGVQGIEEVARRAATAGFLALAPDGLSPVAGYPGNDNDDEKLQRSLEQGKFKRDMANSTNYVRTHAASSGKLGSLGFCQGGGATNHLAVTLGQDLHAAVPFYGWAAASDEVSRIKASLRVQSAENDPRINTMWPDLEAALKTNGCS